MPKERIYSSEQYQEDSGRHIGIDVLWGRDTEHVQLATTLQEDGTGEPVMMLLPTGQASTTPTGSEEYAEIHGGWYANLDRQAINSLIRKLRRARDQAFGADA